MGGIIPRETYPDGGRIVGREALFVDVISATATSPPSNMNFDEGNEGDGRDRSRLDDVGSALEQVGVAMGYTAYNEPDMSPSDVLKNLESESGKRLPKSFEFGQRDMKFHRGG
jgi:hypothetical protein